MAPLRFEFGDRVKKKDRERYLVALECLPNRIIAVPTLKFGMAYGFDPRWQVTFIDGRAEYPHSRCFAPQDEANDWASDFRICWAGMISTLARAAVP